MLQQNCWRLKVTQIRNGKEAQIETVTEAYYCVRPPNLRL